MKNLGIRVGLILALYAIDKLYLYLIAGLNEYPLIYFLAGLAGVATVLLLPLFGNSQLVKDVRIIQTIWIGVHAFGFVLYMFYFSPELYENMQTVLNITQTLWLIWARHDTTNHRLYDNRADGFFDPNTYLRGSYTKGQNQ